MSATPTEKPFTISIPDARLAHLQKKLALTTFPDELDSAGWAYGVPLADMRRLVARWQDGFDWRAQEAKLNAELPQFTRDIDVVGHDTLNVHYVHQRSEVVNAVPLLFVHGWPGCFLEVRKILPLLVQGSAEHPAFHVVALGLPGYGFSEAPKKKGFGLAQYAEVGHKLMLALGYDEYVTQGGDWGHMITTKIAQDYGHKHSRAMHSNFPLALRPHPVNSPLSFLSHLLFGLSNKEKEGIKRAEWFFTKGDGYDREHCTQPQTIGYSLADSPVGLLAWIYEKMVNWTDEYPWDDDEVLTWVSLYWFSRAGPAATIRIYYEVRAADPQHFENHHKTTIPLGFSYFPKDLVPLPSRWCMDRNRIFVAEHDKGGHFAAHEVPEVLVGDLRKMFGKGGPAFGVVPGKTGYA